MITFPATFPRREGDQTVNVSYKDYFEQRYDITIRDLKQPLLLSVPKERDRRSGMKVPLLAGFFSPGAKLLLTSFNLSCRSVENMGVSFRERTFNRTFHMIP